MTSMVICQKMCISERLMKSNLKCKIIGSFSNANIRYLNTVKKAPILKQTFSPYVPKRNLFGLFKRATKSQLKIKDNVPDQYTLIYRSGMDRYILYTHITTTLSAIIIGLIVITTSDFSNSHLDFSNWKTPPRETENEIFVYLAAFVAIAAIVQVMVSRLPIRIYNLPEQKKYIFVFYGNFPVTQKKIVCKVGDVIPIPEGGIMPWREGRYLIKDQRKIILLDQYFRRSADLYIMLGIQKDSDVDKDN